MGVLSLMGPSLKRGLEQELWPWGSGRLTSHQGSLVLGLTFYRQLHCHLTGTATIGGFTGVLPLVLLTDSMNHKAETPPDTTIQ